MTDFPQSPILSEVTLVAVTSVALWATVEALKKSMQQAHFARVLLLSDQRPPSNLDESISWRRIDPLASRADYSRFMLRELAEHIETSHALCIQWDGYVLDGKRWAPEFLDYDYIGSVWPQFSDGHTVGNGGFSLRSRRLLRECIDLPVEITAPEDVVISRLCRPQLITKGISFAPEAVALQFAYERTARRGNEFGFHGAFNLVRYLPPGDALRLFQSLEPQMLARSERLEILRWAILRGRFGLAREMLRRLTDWRPGRQANRNA